MQAHKISSIGPFVVTKGRKFVKKEVEEYLSKTKNVITKEDLEFNR